MYLFVSNTIEEYDIINGDSDLSTNPICFPVCPHALEKGINLSYPSSCE